MKVMLWQNLNIKILPTFKKDNKNFIINANKSIW